MIWRAMRSFSERPGFSYSSFASRRPPRSCASRDNSMRGVLPMASTAQGSTGMNYVYNTAASAKRVHAPALDGGVACRPGFGLACGRRVAPPGPSEPLETDDMR